MRKGLKMVAFIIDIAFMPIRFLIGLEICITAAILSDVSVIEAFKEYVMEFVNYPILLKESYEIIFKEERGL